MPALTRRRDRKASQETWLIYYANDVHVGTIKPNDAAIDLQQRGLFLIKRRGGIGLEKHHGRYFLP
jgi:hypothetical protein